MIKFARIALMAGLGAMTAACGSGGLLDRNRPDEFAVQRQAPLVVPPDFNLQPPQPGAPRPSTAKACGSSGLAGVCRGIRTRSRLRHGIVSDRLYLVASNWT